MIVSLRVGKYFFHYFGILLVMHMFFILNSLSAQENPKDEVKQINSDSIKERSLELDIATAELDELIAWNRVLELDTSGTKESLRKQLRSYYGISDPSSPASEPENVQQVVIESANRSEYFKVIVADGVVESVVRLTGNVILSVEEADLNRSHRVSADSILFNEKQNTISALGNIKYVVKTGDREENFTGDSLTFAVNDWTGVIFRGTSERKEEVEKEFIDFYFSGEAIKRSGADILVLTDGSISSDTVANPEYSLRAKKIWITGPGEWGLLSATLYVGHIPVLYLPFYWKSGQDLFFNPVIGSQTRLGYYIQTTSYLIGSKEQDDGFSILGFGDSASDKYDSVRDGLYIVQKPIKTEQKEKKKGSLKYTLDAYSNLGAATGFTGSLPEIWTDASLDFFASAAVTRSVKDDGSPYFNDGRKTGIYWNNTFIGKGTVPIRWGSSINLKMKNWNINFDWYSDPFYDKDFGDRKENFDWLTFLLDEEGETDKPESKTSLKWEIDGSHNLNFSKTSPWLKSISIERFRTTLSWSRKSNTVLNTPDRAYNPAREFFYPSLLTLPDFKLKISGGFPDYTLERKTKKSESEFDGSKEQVVESGSEMEILDKPIEKDSSEPLYIKSFESISPSKIMKTSINYDVNSTFLLEDKTENTEWKEPADIGLDFIPARVNTTHRGNVRYQIDFWGGIFAYTGSSELSGYYQVHTDLFNNAALVAREEDYKYTKFLWDSNNTLTYKPFLTIPSLKSSSITYKFDANFYKYQFLDTATVDKPAYMGQWITDKDDISKHNTAASLVWSKTPFTVKSSFTADVPPLEEKYTIKSSVGFIEGGWTANLSQDTEYQDEDWDVKPLSASASWKGWKDELVLSQNLQYDFSESRLSSMNSSLKIWGFEADFTAKYANTYDWVDYAWVSKQEAFVPTRLDFKFKRSFEPNPWWKNRIRFKTTLDISWKINLSRPTENVLTFKWIQTFKIHKFLDLSFSFSSTNRSMYQYFPWWQEQLRIGSDGNFFEDLAKSFNLFNEQDRIDSQFNMDSFAVTLVHRMKNWDLSVEYSGKPVKKTNDYIWQSKFSIFIKWNPLPMFNQKTIFEDEKWEVESFK